MAKMKSALACGARTFGVLGLAGALLAGCQSGSGAGDGGPLAVQRAPACTDVVFPIYFAPNSDQLTSTAQQVLTSAAAQVKGCRIGYVNVLGLTDAAGTPADNLELSKRRATAVAQALASAGLPAPKFEVSGVGESGAVSEHGRPVPLRRKTEVIIHPLPN